MESDEDNLEIREAKQVQHIRHSAYLLDCFEYHKGGFLFWKQRPRNHFRSYSVSERWNKDHAGKNACKIDFPYYTITLNGSVYKAHTLIYLFHLATTRFFPLIQFTGKSTVAFPYKEEEGKLVYTKYIRHVNTIPCDNRVENLVAAPLTHLLHEPLPRDTHFKIHHEVDYDRYAVLALKHNKVIRVVGYETTAEMARRTLFDLKRIFS